MTEIALAAVLLIGAGLLLRSFSRVLDEPEGFEKAQVLTIQMQFPGARYPTEESRSSFMRQALERVNASPGVVTSAVISRLPMNPGNSTRGLDVRGRSDVSLAPDYLVITPSYFKVMGIRLLAGRGFDERDDAKGPPVVVVNQALVQRVFPNENPLGQRVTAGACGKEGEWCEIVGVVEDVKQHSLDKPAQPAVFVPYMRDPWVFAVFVVQTHLDPTAIASAVESAIHSVDRDQVLFNVRPMTEVVSQSLSPRRLKMLLIGAFAGLALVLACVGVYAVMAYSVAQRTQEIGVRIALGAARSDVLRAVVGDAMKLAIAGIAIGAAMALAVTRFLKTMLYETAPTDSVTFASVCGLLVLTAIAASLIPAWRAARVDPLTSLRVQ